MRKILYLLLIMLVALGAACSQVAEEVTPTPTPVITPAPTATPGPAPTPTSTQSPAPTATPAPTSAPTPAPIVGSDDYDRPFELKSVPQRIVSLDPSNTETLFALGLGDIVVGVTDYCNYPEEATEKTKVGSLYPGFSLEQIVALEPDLVLGFGYTLPNYVPKLEKLGLTVIVLAPEDLDGILSNIELVGMVTATEVTAKAITDDMRKRIEAVVTKTKDAARPMVLWEFDGTDTTKPWVAGPGSFNDVLIELAGGENVGADGAGPAFQMSAEAIVAADPEIVLLSDFLYGVSIESVTERAGWTVISAVRNDRICPITDPNLTDRRGPRIVEGLEMVAEMIHPELFD
ncbi:ABC transporter substrate-binding protein [Chloroflexota bacterium]